MKRVGRLTDPGFKASSLKLQEVARDLYGARSQEIADAAKVLRRTIARVLSVRGAPGNPSSPGEPPHRQEGQLSKSVAQGLVNDGRRVGVFAFYGLWQETGLVSRGAKHQLTLPPRPFMQRSIDLAKDEMVGVLATVGGKHLEDKLK